MKCLPGCSPAGPRPVKPEGEAGASEAGLDEVNRARACDLLGLSYEQRQGPTVLDLPAGSTLTIAEHQAAVIAAEIAALEERADGVLAELDETDQTAARLDRGPGVDPTIRLYHRYRKDADRQRSVALAELRQMQSDAAAARKAREKADAAAGQEWYFKNWKPTRHETHFVSPRAETSQPDVTANPTIVADVLHQAVPARGGTGRQRGAGARPDRRARDGRGNSDLRAGASGRG